MKKITDNLVKMLPYLLVNGLLFASARFLITDTGFGIFMLLFICPLIIFISSIIYGKCNKFNLLYGILIGLIILGLSLTLYSSDLYFYAIIYGIIARAGNAIGFAFSTKKEKKKASKIGQIIIGIVLVILSIILILFALNLFAVNHFLGNPEITENNIYPKNTVWFTITNLSEKNLEKIHIATNEEGKCGLVSDTIKKLTTDETKTLMLDFTQQKKLNCNMPSEGNYILTWEKNGTVNRHGFGYFTSWMPTTTYLNIIFDRNGEIRISRKGSDVEGEEIENKKEGEDITRNSSSIIINFDDETKIESVYQYGILPCIRGDIFLYQKGEKKLIFTSKQIQETDFPFCSTRIEKINNTHAKIYICYGEQGGSDECSSAVFDYNIENNIWTFLNSQFFMGDKIYEATYRKENPTVDEINIPEIKKLFAYMKKQGYNYTIQNPEVFGDYDIK